MTIEEERVERAFRRILHAKRIALENIIKRKDEWYNIVMNESNPVHLTKERSDKIRAKLDAVCAAGKICDEGKKALTELIEETLGQKLAPTESFRIKPGEVYKDTYGQRVLIFKCYRGIDGKSELNGGRTWLIGGLDSPCVAYSNGPYSEAELTEYIRKNYPTKVGHIQSFDQIISQP